MTDRTPKIHMWARGRRSRGIDHKGARRNSGATQAAHDFVSHFVRRPTDTGTDSRGKRTWRFSERIEQRPNDARYHATPAGVDHGHTAGPSHQNGHAVGSTHRQDHARLARPCGVGFSRYHKYAWRRTHLDNVRPMHLVKHRDIIRAELRMQ